MGTKTDYKERFEQAMRASGMDVQSVADALGISYQAIKKVIAGTSKMLKADNNSAAAKLFKVDPDWLATGEGSATGCKVWPLSDDLLQALRSADAALQRRADNAARAVLGMEPLTAPGATQRKRTGTLD
jgi:transcriptional regulator with XRE-family HTH domain